VKKRIMLTLYSLFLLFTLISCVYAEEKSFADQFLGSPLLVLVAIIVIDIIAFIYHKLRK
jgi:hypothetical protein